MSKESELKEATRIIREYIDGCEYKHVPNGLERITSTADKSFYMIGSGVATFLDLNKQMEVWQAIYSDINHVHLINKISTYTYRYTFDTTQLEAGMEEAYEWSIDEAMNMALADAVKNPRLNG